MKYRSETVYYGKTGIRMVGDSLWVALLDKSGRHRIAIEHDLSKSDRYVSYSDFWWVVYGTVEGLRGFRIWCEETREKLRIR